MDILSDSAERFLAATAPEHTATQVEMAALADDWGFPISGPEAGAVLRLLARLTDAERVFEFGSGFGYSATWFLRGGADAVICAEFDEEEAKRGFSSPPTGVRRQRHLRGRRRDGDDRALRRPFDVVLIDHLKGRYADAYRAVLPKVRTGGVIVADNITRGPIDFGDLVAHFEDGARLPDPEVDGETRGIGEYVGTVRSDEAVETAILPVGSGIAVSTKVE